MIIVTQDKKEIVNFNTVVNIRVEECRSGPEDIDVNYRLFVRTIDHSLYGSIGNYSTEERAKEVLEKMINAIGLGMYKYDMPQK